MEKTKITRAEMFAEMKKVLAGEVSEIATKEEMDAFLDHQIELVTKSKKGGATSETQKANIALKKNIMEVLGTQETLLTVSEILAIVPELNGLSNQKVNALLKQLIGDKLVGRREVKRKAVFGTDILAEKLFPTVVVEVVEVEESEVAETE